MIKTEGCTYNNKSCDSPKIKKACYKWCKEKGNRTCGREWRKVVFNDESKKEDGK